MTFWEIILLSLSLSIDSFLVSMSGSVTLGKIRPARLFSVAFVFGITQALMIFIGWFLGSSLMSFLHSFANIYTVAYCIGFLLLLYVGVNMVVSAFRKEEDSVDLSGTGQLLIAAVATSIDAIAVGTSMAMSAVALDDILILTVSVFAVTVMASAAGILGGCSIGCRFGKPAQVTGGIILVIIGLNILISGVFGKDAGKTFPARALETMECIYVHYGTDSSPLLLENYPPDKEYDASYIADRSQASETRCSYLWPFSGTLSAAAAIMENCPQYRDTLTGRVLKGLEEYHDDTRVPPAYSSYIVSAGQSDRYYDDNIWLGIDFTDIYELTSETEYLDEAKSIWKFIESGTDDLLGGGVYWCEQKRTSKNACSNAPASVLALKLFAATGDSLYLERGIGLYDWMKKNLLDRTDSLYFDNVSLDGKVTEWKFAYNSGQMVQAGAMLYEITGDETYLDDAGNTAASCYRYFFEDVRLPDGKSLRILKNGNIWFSAVMTRGFVELYGIDGNPLYLEAVANTLDVAWKYGRTPEGLFGESFTGNADSGKFWLLSQAAMAEMYARVDVLDLN